MRAWRSIGGRGFTEDDFLGGREHVEGECHFVLEALALQPVEEGGGVGHLCEVGGGA